MNLKLTKQSKIILLSLLGIALLGGVGYGGWRHWQSQRPATEPRPPVEEQEKAYEIIDNPDGSHTFVCYKFGFKFNYPEGWKFSEEYSNLRGATGTDKVGAVKVIASQSQYRGVLISALLPRDRSKYPTLRDYVADGTDAELPTVPNFEVSGRSAYRYLDSGPTISDTLVLMFETVENTFKISLPWEKRNDPEYMNVLNSFELIDSRSH